MGTVLETIIFCNDLKKNELEKSIALMGGQIWNVRIMGSAQLAKYALMHAGITIDEKIIDRQDMILMMAEIMESMSHEADAYFHRTNYQDAVNVVNAVSHVRRLIPDNERVTLPEKLLDDRVIFDEKNRTLVRLYNKYMEMLDELNGLDSIGLIRKAVSEVPKGTLKAKFVTVSEFPLSPLDEALLNTVSDGSISEIPLSKLFDKDKSDTVRVDGYCNNYGISNEAEYILTKIYEQKSAADKSLIVMCSAADYSQAFYDLSIVYNIPITFGCGVALINSAPGKLLNLYYHWKTDGYYGVDALSKMIFSKYFNRQALREALGSEASIKKVVETCGALRLTDNEVRNAAILADQNNEAVIKMAGILSLPLGEFIRQFAVIRFANVDADNLNTSQLLVRKLDYAAVTQISETFSENFITFMENSRISVSDIIPQFILGRIMKEGSRAGYIHLTDVQGGFSVIRENVYICGLTCRNYPGTPTENYLILDDDYRLFAGGERYISTARVADKKKKLIDLVQLYTALDLKVNISYAGLNVSELKQENASSILFDLYRREHGGEVSYEELLGNISQVGYFDTGLSNNVQIGRSYINNDVIRTDAACERIEQLREDAGLGRVTAPGIFVASLRGRTVDGNATANVNVTEGMNTAAGGNATTDEAVSLDDMKLSPSAIETYLKCPHRFMYKYLLKIPEVMTRDSFAAITPADEGNLAHKVMCAAAANGYALNQYMEYAEEVIDEFLRENSVLVDADGAEARSNFLEMMREAYQNRPEGVVLMTEENIECVHTPTGLNLSGRPDCIMKKTDSDDCVVIDYKTGYSLSHEDNDVESCIQTIVYAYMAEKNDYTIEHSEYRYLRLNQKVQCVYDDNAVAALDAVLEKLKESAKTADFPRSVNTEECINCKYKSSCWG